ncbi:Dienelactone hydrolase family protein [Mycobacterium basiliense]|uniref:Dienelactone hydrolase family protein n=1 Tax=Mycobacterium basiliense TaxID=2094119 RepID=A0A447GGG1_9MYCO|nr:dienelactone hydrolase family protein [Mycobacterium basiliense]VDM89590.1 Dienelactone hydrolase family protein [Mycobacterium basiliense]
MPHVQDSVFTPDGSCSVSLFLPATTHKVPGVVMYPDVGGSRPIFQKMAATMAGFGYAVLLPDMYYRHRGYPSFSMPSAFTDPTERARMMALGDSLIPDMMASDAVAYFDYLSTRAELCGNTFGVCGYCRGGRISLIVAGRCPDRVAAAASFHGSQLAADNPNSPHLLADRMRAKVYVAAADNDELFPPHQAATLQSALSAAGVDHTIETYTAEHGFAVPDNPGYDAAAARRHWDAVRDFFGSALAAHPGSGS